MIREAFRSALHRPTLFFATILTSLTLLAGPASAQRDTVPDTSVRGPVLELDFPEIHIGVAE